MTPFPTVLADDKRQVLLKREEWGGLPPLQEDEGLPLSLPVPAVLYTYTETDMCFEQDECKRLLLNLREQYKEMGLYELPWNFVVGGDGTVFEVRGWTRQPEPHIQYPEWAGKSVEIAHVGAKGKTPNQEQMIASWYVVNGGIINQPVRYVTPLPVRRTVFFEFGRRKKEETAKVENEEKT